MDFILFSFLFFFLGGVLALYLFPSCAAPAAIGNLKAIRIHNSTRWKRHGFKDSNRLQTLGKVHSEDKHKKAVLFVVVVSFYLHFPRFAA